MRLDLTITLGNLLTIVGYVVTVLLAWSSIKERLITLDTKMDPLWRDYNRRHYDRRADDRGDE